MIGKHNLREIVFLSAGAAACLLLASHPASLGGGEAVAGSSVKTEKFHNFRILAGGLGTPTDVSMVNQVIPRVSMYSNPISPMVDVLNRTDLLVTTSNNLSGLPPVVGFPPGAVARVKQPTFPNSKFAPPDNNGDGLSDNVVIFSENSASFVMGTAPVVISPGTNGLRDTVNALDDQINGPNITFGANGVPESGRCGDDVQALLVGVFVPSAIAQVITPGPNGILETNPAADDLVGPSGGCAANRICVGANGVAQSGRGGDDVQVIPCIGRFLDPNTITVSSGQDHILQTSASSDDQPVITAGADDDGFFGANFDADTMACRTPAGAVIAPCDDVQVVPQGTSGLAGVNTIVVSPGPNGVLETTANSSLNAGPDGVANTAACREMGDPAGAIISPCDDVQLVPVGMGGLGFSDPVIGPGPDNVLQTPPNQETFFDYDFLNRDQEGITAGVNRTAESGPTLGDDVAVVTGVLKTPNLQVPPVSAPVGIESVVNMYPAVANMVDPAGNPSQSGSVAFLSSGVFSVGSNGINRPEGNTRALAVGLPQPGVKELGVISGAEAATDGGMGLLSGLSGFTYGGFGWTDLSFKRAQINLSPPSLKDNVYYATREDGGVALIHYRRGFVSQVLPAGTLDAPTDLVFIGPFRELCAGNPVDGGNSVLANCGSPVPAGANAGALFIIESGTGRIAQVPLEISNSPTDAGLCVGSTVLGTSGSNPDSGQGDFCDPQTGLQLTGGPCISGGTCHLTGVGLPNTRLVGSPAGITYITPQGVTDPVALTLLTKAPVPHTGRLTTGANGLAETAPCSPNPPASCDDVLVVPVGQGFPNTRGLEAPFLLGAYNLQTTAQGDDVVIGNPSQQVPGGMPPTSILTGLNGIADTRACNPGPVGSCATIQRIPLGQGEPFQLMIGAGPNGLLDTTPAGDDTLLESPTLLVANRDGTVVWSDLQGADPIIHTGPPRFFDLKLDEITGLAVGDYVNGEGFQVLATTTDFGGGVVSFDPTLNDNSHSRAASLQILNDLNDTVSTKLDPAQVPLTLPASTQVSGLTHVSLDYYPGPDGYIGTPDDLHFNNPNNIGDVSNISVSAISEPNEVGVNGQGANNYFASSRLEPVKGGSYGLNTLNSTFDGLLDDDPTPDLFNFISGLISIDVGLFPKMPNAILAGSDRMVQTTACRNLGGALIPGCDDVQLTLAGRPVFSGPRGMHIMAGPNGIAESGIGGDDVQMQSVGLAFGVPGGTSNGSPYTIWTQNVVGVAPGPNGVRDSLVGGDDVTAGCAAQSICTGPNGVVNTGLGADDDQLLPVGTGGLMPTAPVVGPGKDEFIQTTPGGDDFLGGGQPLQIVVQPGPDGILQTPPQPGDETARLTPLRLSDLDVFAFSRPIVSAEFPTMPYAFLDPAGVNSGVVDINNGFTANSLDAAVDGMFPNSGNFLGPSFDSPTGEIDFIVRNISLTAAIDNNTGFVFGIGVERNSRIPPISLVFLEGALRVADNALVGSAIIGRQFVRTPGRTFEQDRLLKALAKKK